MISYIDIGKINQIHSASCSESQVLDCLYSCVYYYYYMSSAQVWKELYQFCFETKWMRG